MLQFSLALLLFQAVADEPPPVSAKLDEAVRAMPGDRFGSEKGVIDDEAFLKRVMRDRLDAGRPRRARGVFA